MHRPPLPATHARTHAHPRARTHTHAHPRARTYARTHTHAHPRTPNVRTHARTHALVAQVNGVWPIDPSLILADGSAVAQDIYAAFGQACLRGSPPPHLRRDPGGSPPQTPCSARRSASPNPRLGLWTARRNHIHTVACAWPSRSARRTPLVPAGLHTALIPLTRTLIPLTHSRESAYPHLNPAHPHLNPAYPHLHPAYPHLNPAYPHLNPAYPHLNPAYPSRSTRRTPLSAHPAACAATGRALCG